VGGLPVTGTIARTVTNVRAGATSPLAGVIHSLAVLAVVLLAAPLALHVPLAVLAGILLFVAWNMGDWREFSRLRQFSAHYRLLLLGTFGLTVVFDVTVAIEFGMAMACLLFVLRMGSLFTVEGDARDLRYTLSGALFFASVARIDALGQAIARHHAGGLNGQTVVLDASRMVALDTTGVEALRDLHQAITRLGGTLQLEHLLPQPASLMERAGLTELLAPGADRPAHAAR
jgi:SulP family sulfate permease